MGSTIGPARKGVIFQRTTAQFKPFEEASASVVRQLKLNRPASLLLNDGGPGSDFSIANHVADPDFHKVATTQFAVDSQIEKRSISKSPVLLKKERIGLPRSDGA